MAWALSFGVALFPALPICAAPADPPTTVLFGETDFNVTDRLAITNLLGAIVYGFDEMRLGVLISTLAPEFTAEYQIPGSPTAKIAGRDSFEKVIAKRFEIFKNEGVRRRHIVSPPFFLEQTSDQACVIIHFLACTSTDYKNWHPTHSTSAEFRVAKKDGKWLFTSEIERCDCEIEIPLNKMLPPSAPVKP